MSQFFSTFPPNFASPDSTINILSSKKKSSASLRFSSLRCRFCLFASSVDSSSCHLYPASLVYYRPRLNSHDAHAGLSTIRPIVNNFKDHLSCCLFVSLHSGIAAASNNLK